MFSNPRFSQLKAVMGRNCQAALGRGAFQDTQDVFKKYFATPGRVQPPLQKPYPRVKRLDLRKFPPTALKRYWLHLAR